MDPRKCKMWDNIKMANVINVVRIEEIGLKKIEGL